MSRIFYEPKKLTNDQLAYMKLEDLQRYMSEMENIKASAVDNNYDPKKWEIELAYSQRELQLREISAAHHEKFMLEQQEEENKFLLEEASLPVVNFDNFRKGSY